MNAAVEACQIAQNLARNCGYAVFPCSAKKTPTWPKDFGGSGHKDASRDPDRISWLWKNFPGPLIGVACGERSGISVLDVDQKHDTARAWWRQHEILLPTTTTFRTRGGGLHLVFRHASGVRNVEGNPVKGIDVRGEGGYFIFWFAAGFECVDHAPAAPWPHWLTTFFWPPPPQSRPTQQARQAPLSDRQLELVKQRAVERVKSAPDGQKHSRLRAAARLLGGIQHCAGFSDADAIGWLMDALPASAKDRRNAEKTAAWGLQNGRNDPLDLGIRP